MLDSNLPETSSYSDWNWTKNASVALTPGPHVVTLCFIGNAVVRSDLDVSIILGVQRCEHERRINSKRLEGKRENGLNLSTDPDVGNSLYSATGPLLQSLHETKAG